MPTPSITNAITWVRCCSIRVGVLNGVCIVYPAVDVHLPHLVYFTVEAHDGVSEILHGGHHNAQKEYQAGRHGMHLEHCAVRSGLDGLQEPR